MTAIRHALQRELFQPCDERLLTCIHVTRDGKKKPRYLCLTISTDPTTVKLHEVQYDASDKRSQQKTWKLRDLRVVDGKNPRKNLPNFELTLEGKVYAWAAIDHSQKESFIKQLWVVSNKYLSANSKPDFVNVPLPVDDPDFQYSSAAPSLSGGGVASANGDGLSMREAEEHVDDYVPISAKEEQDFRKLMTKCNKSIGRAEEFAEQLSRELSALDHKNIEALLMSESEVENLMTMIDSALTEATELEDKLNGYDELLAHVRDSVEQMEERDSSVHQQSNNRKKLFTELESFIEKLDFTQDEENFIAEANLSELASISRTTKAAVHLQQCLNTKLTPGMEKMKAYSEQMKRLRKLALDFAEKLSELDDAGEGGISFPKHTNVHNALNPYTELVGWLKQTLPEGHKVLLDRYVRCFSQVYGREFGEFFERLKVNIRGYFGDRKSSIKKSISSGEKLALKALPSSDSSSRLNVAAPSSEFSAEVDDARIRFERIVDKMLKEIEPVVLQEEKFIERFFHLTSDVGIAPDGRVLPVSNAGNQSPSVRPEVEKRPATLEVMLQLCPRLDAELNGFVDHCDRENPFYTMHLFAKLWKYLNAPKGIPANSYAAKVLGMAVIVSKRKFDLYMESKILELNDMKLGKRMRVGILPFLLQFEDLASEAEIAFRSAERRNDIDRWYGQLVNAMMDAIKRLSLDPNSKSPAAVVQLENYHRLFSMLSQLKINCLENHKKEAKQRYHDSLKSYVVEYMGKPLDKLSLFFDSIERAIEQGLKAEEVGYQMAYNKQELKKLIKEYPGKEIKKGLEQLYRKIEKHLSEEENLLQVVWHEMQNEFINQYKQYELLIAQCYPNSGIVFEFAIDDILQYCSDIAQSH